MSADGLTVNFDVRFTTVQRGRKRLEKAPATPPAELPPGKIPRISRLMALAVTFEDLLRTGQVRDHAELAALGQVTTARISQILGMRNLASDIQEQLLNLPLVQRDRDVVTERQVRDLAVELDWGKQREMWRAVVQSMKIQDSSARP